MEPTSSFNLLSPPLRRVLDALLEGRPVAPADEAALTSADHAELQALARTAHLTNLTLHQPETIDSAEAAALEKAQAALSAAGARVSAHPQALLARDRPSFLARLKSFLKIEDNTDD
jgi:hypothetical protein